MKSDIVMVTGSNQGIGLACAAKFLYEGYTVYGLDNSKDTSKENERLTYLFPVNYKYIHCDVSDESTYPTDIPPVGYLINNAGIQTNDISAIQVNLIGLMNITEKYGIHAGIRSIVNVGSVSAHTGEEFPYYVASKGGLLPYTKNVASRIAQFGATCNCISPGGVITDLNKPVIENKDLWSKIMGYTPLKKWASADEIAEWVYFLAATQTSMTGQDIIIDNGENIFNKFIWE